MPEIDETVPEGAPEGPAAPDYSPILERFDSLETQFGERLGHLEQALQPAADPDPPQQYMDAYGRPVDEYGRPTGEPDPYLDDDQRAQQARDQQLRQQIQKEMQGEFSKLLDPIAERLRDQDLAALEDRYPELRKPEAAKAVIDRADELAASFGNPDLVMNPDFIENVYLAEQARQKAGQEVPAGPDSEVTLETGGATPPEPEQGYFDSVSQTTDAARLFGMTG